ncbi:hypothetical protein L6V77_19430 [Myxococcota bacterium]|nr:hypothetical protein [Myxococcota bacterium]
MTAVALTLAYGAGSGALHAVTGPDHVLSLSPAALATPPRAAFGIGLRWGLGHGLGTLVLAVPLMIFAQSLPVEPLAAAGERAGGLALLVMALLSARALRRGAAVETGDRRRPALVGLFHGLTGAGALVLVLPAVAGTTPGLGLAYLAAFGAGSALAMGMLTRMIAAAAARHRPSTGALTRLQWAFVVAGALVGAGLVVHGL